MKEKRKAIDWVYENGYKTIYTGPKPTPDDPTSLSQNTYQIVAAKDIDAQLKPEQEALRVAKKAMLVTVAFWPERNK